MNFVRLRSHEDKIFERAMELYSESFPIHEQRPISSQKKILINEEYHFDLIYDDEIFVGVILYWETKDFVYIEHFCIMPSLRGKNYGSKVLGLLAEKSKIVILEIDPIIDEKSIRRKIFYERSGFNENPFEHIHAPYSKDRSGHSLIVMSYPRGLELYEYKEFSSYLTKVVMDI